MCLADSNGVSSHRCCMCLCTSYSAGMLQQFMELHSAPVLTLLLCVTLTEHKPGHCLPLSKCQCCRDICNGLLKGLIDPVAIIASCTNNSLHDWNAQQVGRTDSISHMSQLMLTQRARHGHVATPQHLHVDATSCRIPPPFLSYTMVCTYSMKRKERMRKQEQTRKKGQTMEPVHPALLDSAHVQHVHCQKGMYLHM